MLALTIAAAILVALGIYLLYFIDRELEENKMYLVLFVGLALVALGIFVIFATMPVELIKMKVLGLSMAVAGFWLAFKFPGASEIQGESFGLLGILLGLIIMIVGIILFVF
ncbi:MAG: hypothetical protein DRN71_03290 [Candidatus Nanohalarchaeota archaeon]|nr:MAG: hypothetical protein DRN71_03290 [Candidatus Nanohaloarchaeota archaeon]